MQIKKFKEFIMNESDESLLAELNEFEESPEPEVKDSDIVPVGMRDDVFIIKIKGEEFGYAAMPKKVIEVGGVPVEELERKFTKMLGFGARWRAVEWLKKNSKNVKLSK